MVVSVSERLRPGTGASHTRAASVVGVAKGAPKPCLPGPSRQSDSVGVFPEK
jgi:hypothetical protein